MQVSKYKKTVVFLSVVATFFTVVISQETDLNSATKPGVYALPEIGIKLKNGTILRSLSNSNSSISLAKELGEVELSCTADYPVKWEYLVKDKTIPVLDIVFRRLVRNHSDFDNPKGNRFMSIVNLRGLLESQSGKYLCRQYNEKLNNNSYTIASYFDIFIKGNRTFNAITSIEFTNKTAPYVNIHCPVTDRDLHVRLYKLNEKHFNITGQVHWKPIHANANYNPANGFRLFAGLGRELLGTYNCTADNGQSIISVVADHSEKEAYHSTSPSISINACWENRNIIQYIRSQRLECFCKDSFGLFMNDTTFEFENRKAACSMNTVWNYFKNCSDWRLEELFGNAEESPNVCYREPVQNNGSGSRPSLKVRGETFPDGDAHQKFPFTKFSITYNGFVDWAGDFMLAVCRKDICKFSRNNGSSESELEYIENEPSRRQYFPMAHQQAEWNDVIVNGTDVKSVYVFQAHSLSYAWFPYATAEIRWGNLDKEDSKDPGTNVDFNKADEPPTSSANSRMMMFGSHYFLYFVFAVSSYFSMSI